MARPPLGPKNRKAINITLAPDVIDWLDSASFVLKEARAQLIEIAVREYLAKLEAERGKPFPSRD